MEPPICAFYEYRDHEGIVVLGCKTVMPDGSVIIHGEEPFHPNDWVKVELHPTHQ